MTPEIPAEKMAALSDALLAGKKIQAIKLYRDLTGEGLKESKDAIEELEQSLRASHPEKFAKGKSGGGEGCLGAAAMLCAGGVVFGFWMLRG